MIRLVTAGNRKNHPNLRLTPATTSGLATSGQGIRVVDARTVPPQKKGVCPGPRLQAGAFNYTLNRDSDEDWYLRSENAYRAEVPCMPPC